LAEKIAKRTGREATGEWDFVKLLKGTGNEIWRERNGESHKKG